MDRSNLKERAADISKTANFLSDELALLSIPEPSFEHGLPAPLQSDAPDSNVHAARQKLLLMLDEYRELLTEPHLLLSPSMASLFERTSLNRNPMMSVHPVVRLGIAENFPREGTTVQDLANKLNLRESIVKRLLAHCATYHIFYQTSPNFFVHTAASKVLAESDGMRRWILIGAEETLPATMKTASALAKYPNSEEPEHCGWSIQNATELPMFKGLAKMPEREATFARAMTWYSKLPGYSAQYLVSAFPWGSGDELTVVDVGGSRGHISQALAEHSPSVKCTVEDGFDVIMQGQESLPENLRGRVSFQAHDFFKEQPVKGADVYLLRLILHDWSDKYATLIIKALIPALKPGAKVVVNDRVVPECGEANYLRERESRDADMYMLAFQNAKERTANDWTTLFKEADPRFQLTKISKPPKSSLAILEITWDG